MNNTEELNATIADLATQNRFMRRQLQERDEILNKIHSSLVCCGGPLNDNVAMYTRKQLVLFLDIERMLGSDTWDYKEETWDWYTEEDE